MLKKMLEEKLKKVEPHKMSTEVSSPKEWYPSIRLRDEELSEIKDWEINKDYYLVMKCTLMSKNMNTEDKKEKYSAEFDIKEIGTFEPEKDNLKEKYVK